MNVLHLNFGDKRSIIPVHNIGGIHQDGKNIRIMGVRGTVLVNWDCTDEKEANEQMDSMKEVF